ncbi:hypothetical protein KQI38_20335 [Tissierella carlieri]|nr:hypothetical protein [Tissierella carlieri]
MVDSLEFKGYIMRIRQHEDRRAYSASIKHCTSYS